MFVVNKQIKIFICFLLFFTVSFSFYAKRKVYAVPVAVVGVIAPEAVVALGALTLTAYGVWQLTPEKNKEMISQKVSDLARDITNFRYRVKNDTGSFVLSWSAKGLNSLQTIVSTLVSDNSAISIGDSSYFVSASGIGDNFYSSVYLSELDTAKIVIIKDSKGSEFSATINGSSTSYLSLDYSNVYNYPHIEVHSRPFNDTSEYHGGPLGISGTYKTDISADVTVKDVSICPDKLLYKDKINDISSNPTIGLNNVGIPMNNTGSVDSPSWVPTNNDGSLLPDVLPNSGSVSDVPNGYTPSGSVPWSDAQPFSQPTTQDIPQDIPKDTPKDIPRDIPKDIPQDIPQDIPKDVPKEDTLDLTIPKDNVPELNFSPLMVATKKFPFCIPWDLWSSYKVFDGNATPFYYKFDSIDVDFGSQTITVIPTFELNFSDYPKIDEAVKVIKYLELMGFIVFIVLQTRKLVRG